MTDKIMFISGVVLTFAATFLILRRLIPVLRSHKMGQPILDIGPRWHKSKEGTPTMGGLSFIVSSFAVSFVIAAVYALAGDFYKILPYLLCLGFGLLNAFIGVIDDSAKLKKRENEGLSAKQKYLLQLVAAALLLCGLYAFDIISTELYIPYLDKTYDLGFMYYVFALVLITGIVNSVNLTDGIDGLASSVTFVCAMFLGAASFFKNTENKTSLSLLSAVLIGSALGFLMYNFYPARVFMGDTGSLFFGGMLVSGAFVSGNPLIVLIFGIIFVLEAVSVILQVTCYKITKKRLFRMAPIHHHFEKCGKSEIWIVCVFSLVALAGCVAAWFGLK